jgi:hypothetical protein
MSKRVEGKRVMTTGSGPGIGPGGVAQVCA